MNDIRKYITEIVEGKQGLKATELAADLAVRMANDGKNIEADNILDEIERMVVEKELVCLEYVLPTMTYRMKMFLLPKGTECNFSK